MKYAITAVTGRFGQVAVHELAKLVPASDIIGLARNVEKAQKMVPAGVTVRPGDYTQEAILADSLQGVDRLLFISSQPGAEVPRDQQHMAVVRAAKKAGVNWIGYTSFPHADQTTSGLAEDHRKTEAAIIESGIAHSFLRNNWYLENELDTIKGAIAGQPFVYCAGDSHVGWTLERLYAEAAAKVLAMTDAKDIYEFAGAPATYADLAESVAQLTNQEFAVSSLSIAEYQKGLEASGLPAEVVGVVTMIQSLIRDGELDEVSSDLPDVLGRPLPSLTAALQELLPAESK
ncbi:NAD(P)H-binding protein [Latilactobacillus sakei]|uniref:NAD(P)H-binding protein n=1 Tax=Latilactobacillus sakei TaxID=1599 RepID=UPI00097559D6|nr:NAD(P)H-binding protein [Latilactobacillus sakei]